MKSRLIFKILFFLWIVTILVLTSYPKLSVPNDKLLNIDKLAHFVVYLILATLFVLMNIHQTAAKTRLQLILFMLIMPILDELHQIPIPGRYFSFYDLLADTLGFLIIIILISNKVFYQKLKRLFRRQSEIS